MVDGRKREIAYVLIGFKRFETLKLNIDLLLTNGFEHSDIYCFVDGLVDEEDCFDSDRTDFQEFCKISLINFHFQKSNLGLKNHFKFIFNEVGKLQIEYVFFIEDDVKISLDYLKFSFFNIKYIENSKIISISAVNHCSNLFNSYHYITRFQHSWGWFTHTRYIREYLNFKLNYLSFLKLLKLEKMELRKKIYWSFKFLGLKFNTINSWAYKWQIFCMINEYNSLVPAYSLCEVNGSDKFATHTRGYSISEVKFSEFDYRDYEVQFDQNRDDYVDRLIFTKGSFLKMFSIPIMNKILKLIGGK